MTRNIERLGLILADLQSNAFTKAGLGKSAMDGLNAVHLELMEQREDLDQLLKFLREGGIRP